MTSEEPLIPLTVTPAGSTTDLLSTAARRWPDRVAIDFLGAELTYAELAAQVAAAAQVLRGHGVGPGDRVLLDADLVRRARLALPWAPLVARALG